MLGRKRHFARVRNVKIDLWGVGRAPLRSSSSYVDASRIWRLDAEADELP